MAERFPMERSENSWNIKTESLDLPNDAEHGWVVCVESMEEHKE